MREWREFDQLWLARPRPVAPIILARGIMAPAIKKEIMGKEIRTHYDNLQVKEDASDEVIKGAYRYLSQKWHPDRNPDNRDEAERVLKILNLAYETLSDPDRRREHDAWIARQRGSSDASEHVEMQRQTCPDTDSRNSSKDPPADERANTPFVPNYLVWSILVTLFCCLPLGIVSIIKSAEVNSRLAAGDVAGARGASATAKTLITSAAIVGCVMIFLFFLELMGSSAY